MRRKINVQHSAQYTTLLTDALQITSYRVVGLQPPKKNKVFYPFQIKFIYILVPILIPLKTMSNVTKKILLKMQQEPTNVKFSDLLKICEENFGQPRQSGTSHTVFKTPWPGDPRVNIQNDKGKAKAYQVRQVLLAIDKLNGSKNEH